MHFPDFYRKFPYFPLFIAIFLLAFSVFTYYNRHQILQKEGKYPHVIKTAAGSI